jgi:heme A synthase
MGLTGRVTGALEAAMPRAAPLSPARPVAQLPTTGGFARFALANVVYNLGVIAWGAFVRASGSGAGCGDHWPTCNGDVIPRAPAIETVIEFTHRLTSGLSLIGAVALFAWAWRAAPAGGRVRRAAGATLVFMLLEAAVGAAIVLLQKVGQDDSVGRAVIMAIHLCNTFLLMGAMALTAAFASGAAAPLPRKNPISATLLGIALMSTLVLGASGAVTALGDTLFPVGSLAEGLAQDFSPTAHLLLRLRVFHPLLAVTTGGLVALAAAAAAATRPRARRAAALVVGLFAAQIGLGLVNLGLMAPVPLQLAHLLLADLVWIALVLLAVPALQPRAA